MNIDLEFRHNQLLLNPRLPRESIDRFETAWRELVEPRYINHVGLATSGSTGDSIGRLILLSKEAVESSARAVNERFASGPHDVWFKSLPSFHVGGLGILVRARLSGARVYEDVSDKWKVHDFFDQLVSSRATLISLVPTQVFDLVQAQLKAPSSVRAVIVGGGRLEDSLRLRAKDLGWPCLPSYGMTETCSQIATALSIDDSRLTLLSHTEARTTADGRLEVKGSSLLSGQIIFTPGGYASGELNVHVTAHATDPKINGWFVTDDRATVQGRVLTIEGRTSDFVKIGGEGVVVARLEERLEHEKLHLQFTKDAAILVAQDERLGAKLILMSTASVAETTHLVEQFNKGVAPFERLREIKYVTEIPRSPLGKLLRAAALE
jgi:O-succinylbenzoic acid--CoA ligase